MVARVEAIIDTLLRRIEVQTKFVVRIFRACLRDEPEALRVDLLDVVPPLGLVILR